MIAAALTVAAFAPSPGATGGAAAAAVPLRIVSLMPSVTEDLFAIGAGADVVASSSFTNYPPEAARLPQIASFSAVDTERIAALHPDLIIGVTSEAVQVRDARRLGLRVVLLDDESYASIFENLSRLGTLTGHVRDANRLSTSLKARTATLSAGVRARARGAAPRVFVVLGTQPIFTVGDRSYIASLLGFAGLRNAATGLTTAYAQYDAEALVAADPDAIVADPMVHLGSVLGRAPWNALRAVREHHVFEIPDADLLIRPGPRYTQGLTWLVSVEERLR